jgi:hypothetical protein
MCNTWVCFANKQSESWYDGQSEERVPGLMPNFCTLLEGVGEGAGGGAVHRADGYRTGHKRKSIAFQLLKKAFSIFTYNGRYTYLEAVPQLEIPRAPSWCVHTWYTWRRCHSWGSVPAPSCCALTKRLFHTLRKAASSLMLHTCTWRLCHSWGRLPAAFCCTSTWRLCTS